jgi:hypothetical protein
LDEVEKSLCWWEASLAQPLHNDEMILALEDGEEDYWMRLRRACAGGEVILSLEEGEVDYWMRLRRASAGGEPAST